MQVQEIGSMLNFKYTKTNAEILDKAKLKVAAVRHKISEREGRIAKIREEYKITDAQIIDMLAKQRKNSRDNMSSYSYTAGNGQEVTIGAGTINNLLTERDYIEGERAHVEKLDMIIRNLKEAIHYAPDGKRFTTDTQTLSCSEIEYLGF